MSIDRIKAHMNLGAVLQNLEELCRLDTESAALIKNWDICIQFAVVGGPRAWVEFRKGKCRAGIGSAEHSDVYLLFATSSHLNGMFAGSATPPIPLKGFKRLNLLKNEFPKITARLEHFLKPSPALLEDDEFVRIHVALTLHTAAFAVRELSALEPTSRKIALSTPSGRLQLSVGEDGPDAWISFAPGKVEAGRGKTEKPAAKMLFKDVRVALDVMTGKVDGYTAMGRGDLEIWGMLPLVDNASLIMDRVERYLS